jgi:hypothetical protein
VLDGPLLDFTFYNPSLAWAAGNLVSDLGDLTRFFQALLGGGLLSPELLAEMTTMVSIGQGAAHGLGLLVLQTPCGRLIGHDGAIPGFITIVLSTQDGRRQFGVMVNQFHSAWAGRAPAAPFRPRPSASELRRCGGAAPSPGAGSGRCSRSGSAPGSPGAPARPPRTDRPG